MSLTKGDLQAIRQLMEDAVDTRVPPLIEKIIEEKVPPIVEKIVEEKIEDAKRHTADGFAEVHGKFTEVYDKFSEVHDKFAEIHGEFTEVHGKFAEVHNKFSEVHDKMDILTLEVRDVKATAGRIERVQQAEITRLDRHEVSIKKLRHALHAT